jgi:transcriptional regulator with XRE-family HTH domain
MDTIGKRITYARESKNYDVNQLSERVGVKAETILAWEADERDPRANRLLRLAGALDVGFAWLMVGQEYAPDEGEDAGRLSSVEGKLQRIRQLYAELGGLITSLEHDTRFMMARDEELEELAELDETSGKD